MDKQLWANRLLFMTLRLYSYEAWTVRKGDYWFLADFLIWDGVWSNLLFTAALKLAYSS